MHRFKANPKSPQESIAIQEHWFKHFKGSWPGGELFPKNIDAPYLFLFQDGTIRFSRLSSTYKDNQSLEFDTSKQLNR